MNGKKKAAGAAKGRARSEKVRAAAGANRAGEVKESAGGEKKRAQKIVALLKKHYPDARCSLDHSTPLELLVATILSAQCTDERVNVVTADLFRKYRRAEDYAAVEQVELERDIHSTGFFRNKAKAIQGTCRMILEKHGGRVPETIEELLELPGVARKTANVVLGNAYGQASGVVVDTHVSRLSRRLGLTEHEQPEKIERDLNELIPQKDWIDFSHLLIAHGRAICKARAPLCGECFLLGLCPTGKEMMNAE
ncbi:MAG: endonuclease III [Acidobacteriota bacterium]|nr:endonuclease III [Acidobacteriota bacterium]